MNYNLVHKKDPESYYRVHVQPIQIAPMYDPELEDL